MQESKKKINYVYRVEPRNEIIAIADVIYIYLLDLGKSEFKSSELNELLSCLPV
jgi:hypothetical protein